MLASEPHATPGDRSPNPACTLRSGSLLGSVCGAWKFPFNSDLHELGNSSSPTWTRVCSFFSFHLYFAKTMSILATGTRDLLSQRLCAGLRTSQFMSWHLSAFKRQGWTNGFTGIFCGLKFGNLVHYHKRRKSSSQERERDSRPGFVGPWSSHGLP